MSKHAGTVEILARGVCVSDGYLLVCHTAGAANTYLPGGHVEFEEGAAGALVRELMEECGVVATAGAFLGAVEHTFIQKRRRHCEVNLVFALQLPGLAAPHAVPVRESHLDFQWLPLATLPASTLEPAVLRRLIPAWLSGSHAAGWGSNYG